MKSDAIPSIFDHSKVQDTSLKYAKCSKASDSEECEASESNNSGANGYLREFVSYLTCQSGSNFNKSDTNSDMNSHSEIILEQTESTSDEIIATDVLLIGDIVIEAEKGAGVLKQPEARIKETIEIEHSYASKGSPHETFIKLKRKIQSLKIKLRKSQKKTIHLKKSIKSLKSLFNILKQKNLISNSCEDVLQDSFSGTNCK